MLIVFMRVVFNNGLSVDVSYRIADHVDREMETCLIFP